MPIDRSYNKLASSISSDSSQPYFVQNAFEADFLCGFCCPQLDKLFIDCGNEGWYAFALHINFFKPKGMSLHSIYSSSGIISMACLNLPAEIQYRPERIYLAEVIPGPKQPCLENLNHYLQPLVKNLESMEYTFPQQQLSSRSYHL